jgi:putative ABC transport system permease protein
MLNAGRTSLQSLEVIRIIVRGLTRRPVPSIAAVMGVTIAVTVMFAIFALLAGLKHTVASSGSPQIAVAVAGGADSELNSKISLEQIRLLEEIPSGIRKGPSGPIVSPELYVIVSMPRATGQPLANVPLRGMGPNGPLVRPAFHLKFGRLMHTGTAEVIVSDAMVSRFPQLKVGAILRLRGRDWRVVGIFTAGGTVYESEVWGDLATVESYYGRTDDIQSVRMLLNGAAAIRQVQDANAADERLQLDIVPEDFYFARQAAATTHFAQFLAWPLALVLAAAAAAGAMNALYASVAQRARETAVLRILGFGRISIIVGGLVESLVLALSAAATATLLSYLLFEGVASVTVSSGFTQMIFRFHISLYSIAQCVSLAVLIGFVGGVLPAVRSAHGQPTVSTAT